MDDQSSHQSSHGLLLQALIDRMNAGDAAARDALIEFAETRIRGIARRIRRDFPRLQNVEETDDVLQKGVVRLLRALATVKVATPREFLQLSAVQIRREMLDFARRPAIVRNEIDLGVRGLDASGATDDPVRLAAWTEFHRKVKNLPEQEREVFDLIWYQGLTQAEAAELLNVSVPTIKRRWMSARMRLQVFVDE